MSATLTAPRSTTLETLQKSRNVAAIATLTTGLNSADQGLRQACLKALAGRKEPTCRQTIIMHWESLQPQDFELLRGHETAFAETAKPMLSGGTLTEKRLALAAIADLDLSDAMDVVLDIAVDQKHALYPQASQCLLDMCQRWGSKARSGRDVATIRGKMMEHLYIKLQSYQDHKNIKLIDAWLCLAHWDDALQRSLISDPRQVAFRALLKRFRESDHPSAIQLLAGYAWRSTTPPSLLGILAERSEPALAIEIAKLLDPATLNSSLKRLQQLPLLQCMQHIEQELQSVNVEVERRIWMMIAASSHDLNQVLRGAVKLSKAGTKEARHTAAEMLRRCRRPELKTLVSALQSSAASIAEEEASLGSHINLVVQWLKSPSLALRKAAQGFLKEFTLENLLEQVRHWPTQMCKAMAQIVSQVEVDVTERLIRELQSPAPKRRLAALQAAQLLECGEAVSQALMPLMNDPRLEVRVRTIDLLSALGHEELERLIPELLADASTDIQDAANRAARRMSRLKRELHVS